MLSKEEREQIRMELDLRKRLEMEPPQVEIPYDPNVKRCKNGHPLTSPESYYYHPDGVKRDCLACRQNGWGKNLNKERKIVLTRAQIVGLFGLIMNLPIDTTVELQSIDTYGHIIVECKAPSTGTEQRFKLLAQGGRELLA